MYIKSLVNKMHFVILRVIVDYTSIKCLYYLLIFFFQEMIMYKYFQKSFILLFIFVCFLYCFRLYSMKKKLLCYVWCPMLINKYTNLLKINQSFYFWKTEYTKWMTILRVIFYKVTQLYTTFIKNFNVWSMCEIFWKYVYFSKLTIK